MEKSEFKERFRELYVLSGCSSITEFAQKLDMNRQSVDRYYNGERCPDAPALAKICEKMNVSADWLLNMSDVKKPSADIRAVCEYTGLSEEAINKINELTNEDMPQTKEVITRLFEAERFDIFIYRFYIFLMNIDNLSEADFGESVRDVEWNNNNVTLGHIEASAYFKNGVEESIGLLCNDLYFQRIQKIKFHEPPARIKVPGRDDLGYVPGDDSK